MARGPRHLAPPGDVEFGGHLGGFGRARCVDGARQAFQDPLDRSHEPREQARRPGRGRLGPGSEANALAAEFARPGVGGPQGGGVGPGSSGRSATMARAVNRSCSRIPAYPVPGRGRPASRASARPPGGPMEAGPGDDGEFGAGVRDIDGFYERQGDQSGGPAS